MGTSFRELIGAGEFDFAVSGARADREAARTQQIIRQGAPDGLPSSLRRANGELFYVQNDPSGQQSLVRVSNVEASHGFDFGGQVSGFFDRRASDFDRASVRTNSPVLAGLNNVEANLERGVGAITGGIVGAFLPSSPSPDFLIELDNGRRVIVPGAAPTAGQLIDQGTALAGTGVVKKLVKPRNAVAPKGISRGQQVVFGDAHEGVRELSSLLRNANVPRKARLEAIQSFREGSIIARRAEGGENVLRFFGGDADALGRFVTPNFPQGNVRSALALPGPRQAGLQFGNPATGLTQFNLREGALFFEGTVAPNFGKPGGATQFFVPNLDDLLPVR